MTEPMLERWLALGIVLVYVLDAIRWLGRRDGVLEVVGTRRWLVHLGASNLTMLGRRPYLPSFARPDRVLLPVHWRLDEPDDDGTLETAVAGVVGEPVVRTLGWLCLTAHALIVFAAPLLLWIGRAIPFTFAIAAGLLVALAAGVRLVLAADRLDVKRATAWGLAALAVVCLPCAPNLLRAALAHRRPLDLSLPAGAAAGARDDAAALEPFNRRFADLLRLEVILLEPDSNEGRAAREKLAAIEGAVTRA